MSLRVLSFGFVLGVLMTLIPSCGGSACNATNCASGCCDNTGKCAAGNQNTACGTMGKACMACVLGQTCGFGGLCTGSASGGGAPAVTGGGSAVTGGGSAVTGGGSAVTGGGSAVTGGGSAVTGGGSAVTGGGSAVTGGGSAVTGGGSAVTGGGSAVTGGGSAVTGGGSGGGSTSCGPQNCASGCCSNGACVGGASPSACGRAGNVCSVCSGSQICTAQGVCANNTGGGSAVTGGGSAVTGGGSAVGGGSVTGGGSAVGGGSASIVIGSPCTSTPQCSSLGSGAYCKLQTTPSIGFTATSYARGFCTLPCTANGQANCGAGNVCAGGLSSFVSIFNESDRFCTTTCVSTQPSGCDTGFGCINVGSGSFNALGCALDLNGPSAVFSGGGVPQNLGQACANNAACANPPDPALATCIGGSDFPAASFVNGLCTVYGANGLMPSSYCDMSNGIRTVLNTRSDGGADLWCLGRCSTIGSTPRTGYRCMPAFQIDGGFRGGVVWPQDCASSAECGGSFPECNTAYGLCCTTATTSPNTFMDCASHFAF